METGNWWGRSGIWRKSFYLTYEEWKLALMKFSINCASLVFTLPMRNGNSDSVDEVRVRNAVFTLPMRNGNYTATIISISAWIVFTLPMRNGNHHFS